MNDRSGSTIDLRRVAINPDYWYPLARSKDLKPGKTIGACFGGEPIVLGRTSSGVLFALEDRCAHRQVPLHMGVIEGESLRCAYHGWCYDTTGKITRVPYLPKGSLPPRRTVRSYPCKEAYGLIFVFPGDPKKAEKVSLPDIPEWSSPEYFTMYFSRTVRCHYTFLHENLMDMNHQFLHRRLMGNVQPVMLSFEQGEGYIEARYKFRHDREQPHVGSRFLVLGARQATKARSERDFELMVVRTQYPYQVLTVYPAQVETTAVKLWAVYVPTDREQRVNRSFGLLMVRKPPIPGLIYLAWPIMRYFTERVFRQDKAIVEAEQRAYDQQGADLNQEVFPLLLKLRQLLAEKGVAPEHQLAQAPLSNGCV